MSPFPTTVIEQRMVSEASGISSKVFSEVKSIDSVKRYIKEKKAELDEILNNNDEWRKTTQEAEYLQEARKELKKKILESDETAKEIKKDIKAAQLNLKVHQISLSEYLSEYHDKTKERQIEGREIIRSFKLK